MNSDDPHADFEAVKPLRNDNTDYFLCTSCQTRNTDHAISDT